MNNNLWAHYLVDQLIQQGVDRFCIAPGSRSTSLALAAARHPKAKIDIHFDERGLGFLALGMSLASNRAAALIVTSGTAVGNLAPAVMEAHHSGIPLVLLTADRPPELRDNGANQTSDQVKMFHNFVRWHIDLPCSSEALGESFARSQIAYAAFQAESKRGPVQVNCQFREPIFHPPAEMSEGSRQHFFFSKPSCEAAACKPLLEQAKRGLILIGRLNDDTCLPSIFRLAQLLQWPIFADLLSHGKNQHPQIIQHFDYAIRSNPREKPDLALHFGGRMTSKALFEWLDTPRIHVSELERIDIAHKRPTRVFSEPGAFCESMEIAPQKDNGWLEMWQGIDSDMQESIDSCFTKDSPFTEAHFMRWLGEHLPAEWTLFLANGMPIRDAEHFFAPSRAGRVFANRGVSGIDGQIATVAGIAIASGHPIAAVLGDQSCLHDLNSLALLAKLKTPVVLFISNNFGSGVFSHLPVAKENEHFELLFAAAHDFRFKQASAMFDLPYETKLSGDLFKTKAPIVVEFFTSRKENTSFQKQLLQQCGQTLLEPV